MQSADSISFFYYLLKNKSKFFTLLCILSLGSSISAQADISKISFNAGIINNQQYGFRNTSPVVFYPEAELGGHLLKDYLEWSLSFGYWDDGVNEPFDIMDYTTYSYHSYVLGSKLVFFPQNVLEDFILPLHLNVGFSYHYIGQKPVGGEGFTGGYLDQHVYRVPAADLGLGINIKVSEIIRLRLEADLYIPVDKSNAFPQGPGSGSFKLGVDYIFSGKYFQKENKIQ